jgi:hypothetical protein
VIKYVGHKEMERRLFGKKTGSAASLNKIRGDALNGKKA